MIIVIREKGVREYELIIVGVGQGRMSRNLIVIGRTSAARGITVTPVIGFRINQVRMNRNVILIGRNSAAGGRITVGAPVIGRSTVCFGA